MRAHYFPIYRGGHGGLGINLPEVPHPGSGATGTLKETHQTLGPTQEHVYLPNQVRNCCRTGHVPAKEIKPGSA